MKNLFLVILSLLTVNIMAQPIDSSKIDKEFHLSSIDLSSGKGAITSGMYCYVNFENKNYLLQSTISAEDIEISYLYRTKKDIFLAGINGGYFFNIPYAGPQIIFSPVKWFSTFSWFGWSLGKPEGKINLNTSGFLFAANSASLNIWRFKPTYCLINCRNSKPQHTVSLKYSQVVRKNFLVYTDVGYDFLNQRQLLKLGVTWQK